MIDRNDWRNAAWAGSAFFLFATSGCEDTQQNEEAVAIEIEYLEDELYVLKDEFELESEKLDEKRKEVEELKEQIETLKADKKVIEGQKDGIEEDLKDVEEEFKDYRKKYTSKVRFEAIGLAFDSVSSRNGKKFSKVVIREVTPHSVAFRHESGAARLMWNEVPDDWQEKYQLIPEPVEEPPAEPRMANNDASSKKDPESREEEPVVNRTTSEKPKNSSKIVPSEIANSVVLITGNESVGTGFVCEVDGEHFVYTAAHVLSGNTTLELKTPNGTVYRKFAYVEVAEGVDLLRLRMTESPVASLKLIDSSTNEETLLVDAPVVALGDSGGKNVMTKLAGKILGLGSDRFEISSSVIRGNSGGPVMMQDDWSVIGLVTHGTVEGEDEDAISKDTRFSKVRRFACRLDYEHQWKKLSVTNYLSEIEDIEKIDRITLLMFALASLEPGQAGLRLDTNVQGGQTVLAIFEMNKDMKVVRELITMNRALNERKLRTSEKDLAKKFYSLYKEVLNASRRQTANVQLASYSSYHRRSLEQSLELREEAKQAFELVMNHLARFK